MKKMTFVGKNDVNYAIDGDTAEIVPRRRRPT